MSSVWGRLLYWSNIEEFSGPAVHLEAQELDAPRRWSKSMSPDVADELERIKVDGHRVTSDRRYHHISSDLAAIRFTQLFRTLAHEIGHHVDYQEKVEIPSNDDFDEWDRLNDLYFARPTKEREAFAHRYSTEFYARHQQNGHLPFDRLFDKKTLSDAGLDPAWFSDKAD